MPHPECPGKAEIAKAKNVLKNRRKEKGQHGHDKTEKYYAHSRAYGPNIVALSWSDRLHPHDPVPDLDSPYPMAIVYLASAPDAAIWQNIKHRKPLARLVAATLENMDATPWPS